jgi:hypothetical protein
VSDGIGFAEVVEERGGDRRELAAKARRSRSLRQAIRWARVTERIFSVRSTPAKRPIAYDLSVS